MLRSGAILQGGGPVGLAHSRATRALLRSQQGPMAGLPFTSLPLSAETTFQSQEFRVLFLRRLWQPLPLSSFTCQCGRPLDSRGHHRATCPLAGVLGRRGFALESGGSQRMCWCRTWISFLSERWTTAGWKSSSMTVEGSAAGH